MNYVIKERSRISPTRIAVALALVIGISGGTAACATPTNPKSAPDAAHDSTSLPAAPAPSTGRAAQCLALSKVVLGVAAVANNDPSAGQDLAALRGLEKSGPPEIRPDIVIITDFLSRAVTAVRDHQVPDLKETPSLRAALQHDAEWTLKNCPAQ